MGTIRMLKDIGSGRVLILLIKTIAASGDGNILVVQFQFFFSFPFEILLLTRTTLRPFSKIIYLINRG